ncbi:MAG: T9SS type A sorting domain-containing protein [Ignavibacteriae bacterium]|nr:T9SS type A sorting domain-containing protein [Ignavibacteriota bacterium]
MKISAFFNAFFSILIVFFFSSTISAQIDGSFDPFGEFNSIKKSAESFLLEIVDDSEISMRTLDFNKNNLHIEAWDSLEQEMDILWYCSDVISADLNGDAQDEIVMILYDNTQGANIFVYDHQGKKISSINLYSGTINCNTSQNLDNEMTTTTLVVGNFIDDPKEEFALAYAGTDNKFHVEIFEAVGENMQIELLASNYNIPFSTKVGHNTEYSYTGDPFDITASDFNNDKIDEIVLVHGFDGWNTQTGTHEAREFIFEAVNYKFQNGNLIDTKKNQLTGSLNWRQEDYPLIDWIEDPFYRIGRPSLACGEFDGNSVSKEIVLGFVVSQHSTQRKGDYHAIQLLDVDSEETICFLNEREIPHPIETFFDFGHAWNSYYWRHHFNINVEAADFTNNGIDDVVVDGPEHIYLYSYDNINGFEETTKLKRYNNRNYEACGSTFAIEDVNIFNDTSITEWKKELVYIERSKAPGQQSGNNTGPIQICIAEFDINNMKFEKIDSLTIQPESYAKNHRLRYILALGDFDKDGIRTGPPELVGTLNSLQEVKIIINAPPVHFDVFNGVEFDLGSAFNDNDSSGFYSEYMHSEGSTDEFSFKNVADWAISGGGGKVITPIVGSINAAYEGQKGEYFEESDFTSESITEVSSITASTYDQYFATKTSTHLFEYPVFSENEVVRYNIVQYPEYIGGIWTNSNSQPARDIRTNHELGNILSYSKLQEMVDFDSLKIKGDSYTMFFEKPAKGTSWELNLEGSSTHKILHKLYHKNSWEVNLRLGAIASFAGIVDVGGYETINAKGKYDTERIISSATKLGTGTNIKVNFGKLDRDVSEGKELDYLVTPYVFYSANGELVLDYITEPIAVSMGNAIDSTWWDIHYSKEPDLAFILPWRYDAEKWDIIISEQKRTQTKDLLLSPLNLGIGDTLNISTRIHNYSLKDLNKSITIQYYLGDPDNGGELMNILYNGVVTSEILLYANLPKRDELDFDVKWVIPSEVNNIIRIYSVIDPRNEIDEIHENNNKGNVVYIIPGTTAIEENESNLPKNYSLKQNYPNPFNPSTHIEFSLPKTEIVKVEIFDIMGQRVKTLLHEKRFVGNHKLKFDASKFASGVYFYKITVGDFIKSRKMLFLK